MASPLRRLALRSGNWGNTSGYDSAVRENTVIVYEYPFNERVRTYLRLEYLYRRLVELAARESALDHHFAILTLFEIMDVGGRSDLKSEVLRDLEREKQVFGSYRDNPHVTQDVLDDVLQKFTDCFDLLNQQSGKTGQALASNDWLMSIRSRAGIPGGTCAFDLPAYFAWQHDAVDRRRSDLAEWMVTLNPLVNAVLLLLKVLRDSGLPQKVMANAGQYQQTLPQGRSFQLLRLALEPSLGIIPEISANRLIVSIRMMQQASEGRLTPWAEDAPFELALCS